MKAIKLCGLMFPLSIGTEAAAIEDSVMKELVPTGKLRVAIAVSPARAWCSPLPKERDPARLGLDIYRGTTCLANCHWS